MSSRSLCSRQNTLLVDETTELVGVETNPVGDMFRNVDLFRTMKLSSGQVKEKRLKLTGAILEPIIRWS